VSRGTSFRVPRKTKKAKAAFFRNQWDGSGRVTPRQWTLLKRCWFVRGSRPRKNALHVAMGDTSALRIREREERGAPDGRASW
jgi:hypothetical protein